VAGAAALTVLSTCAGLGALPLTQPDEGRNAWIALEMAARGEWVVPVLNGHPYLDKPAFFFVLVSLSTALLGVGEAAVRAPSALAGLALAGATFAFVRRAHGPRVAALALCVLATTPLYVAFARLVIFDMTLTAFVCAAIFCGWRAEEAAGAGRRRWYLAASASAGLATLVKGPVGFVLPALVHFAATAAVGRRGVWRRALRPANAAAFVAVVVPWLAWVSLREPGFLHYGLVVETASRLTDGGFRRNQPVWYYPWLLLQTGLPWSLLVPGGLWLAWRARRRLAPLDVLCLVWVAVVVAFFSLSQAKQPAYVLSLAVPLAIATGRLLDAALRRPEGGAARLVRWTAGGLGVVLAAAGIAAAALGLSGGLWERLPRFDGPPAELWQPVLLPVAAVALLFCAALVAARLLRRDALVVAALVLLLPALVLAAAPGAVRYADARSSREVAARLGPLGPTTEVACLHCFPSALPFYLERPVTLISASGAELRSNYVERTLAAGGTWPRRIVPRAELASWLASRETPLLLLADEDTRVTLEALAVERSLAVDRVADELWALRLPPAGGR